jgi:insulysin
VRDLLARFELLIEGFLQELEQTELPESRFQIIKDSLQSTLEQPPKSLTEMGKLLKNLAFRYDGDFDWISKRIEGFKELTYPEFIEIANQSFGKQNKQRFAILVKGTIPEEQSFNYMRLRGVNDLRKSSEYTPQ